MSLSTRILLLRNQFLGRISNDGKDHFYCFLVPITVSVHKYLSELVHGFVTADAAGELS